MTGGKGWACWNYSPVHYNLHGTWVESCMSFCKSEHHTTNTPVVPIAMSSPANHVDYHIDPPVY